MEYELNDIELADSPVISTLIDLKQKTIIIIASACFYVPTKKRFGKTILTITGWTDFTCYFNIYDDKTERSYETIVREQTKVETFMSVLEVIQKDKNLKLGGFSDESHNWMEYRFENAKVHVAAEERSDDNK